MNKIVQVNLNRQVGSNDLILQFMRETDVAVAAISEPNFVPDDPGWIASTDELAAITWRGSVRAVDCLAMREGRVIMWPGWARCTCVLVTSRPTGPPTSS